MSKPYKILALIADHAGCGYYRVKQPAEWVNKMFPEDIHIEISDKIGKDFYLGPDGKPKIDLVIHQRQYLDQTLYFAKEMQKVGIPSLYEIDDDLHNVSPYSSAYNVFKDPKIFHIMEEYFKLVNAKTVTTSFLANRYGAQYILPNSLDFDNWGKYQKKDNGNTIVIGWAGSSTHYADIAQCADAVQDVILRYPNVKLALGGWAMKKSIAVKDNPKNTCPADIFKHTDKFKALFGKYIEKGTFEETDGRKVPGYTFINLQPSADDIRKQYPELDLNEFLLARDRSILHGLQYRETDERHFFTKLPKDKIIDVPWVTSVEDTPKVIQGFDIGLAPLEDIIFNNSKSNLKWLEYSALKIPCIASNVGPYGESIVNNETGLLVKSKGAVYADWTKKLVRLIESKEERERLGNNAYTFVKENYNMEKNAKMWRDAWIEIIEKNKKG